MRNNWRRSMVALCLALGGCAWLNSPDSPQRDNNKESPTPTPTPAPIPPPTPDLDNLIFEFHKLSDNKVIGDFNIEPLDTPSEDLEKISGSQLRVTKPQDGQRKMFIVYFSDGVFRARFILEKSKACPADSPFQLRVITSSENTSCGPATEPKQYTIEGSPDAALYFYF